MSQNVTAFDADLAKVVENIAEYHKQMNAVDYPRALEAVWNIISRTNKVHRWDSSLGFSPKKMVTRNNWQQLWLSWQLAFVLSSHSTIHDEYLKCHHGTTWLGLGLLTLKTWPLAGFPWKCHSGCQRNSNLPTSRYGRRDCLHPISNELQANHKRRNGFQKKWNSKSEKDRDQIWDFDKVEIRVAEVKEVEQVEGSDKLLRFRLDAGDGEDRQILSGIAKFYPNEQELVGKKLQIVGQPQTT